MQIKKDTPLKEILNTGEVCQRRNHCCRFGSGFLVGDDLINISRFLVIKEDELIKRYLEEKELFNKRLLRPRLKPKKEHLPYGECIFFSGDGCRIHKVKPLQCRVGNCNEHGEKLSIWFMLNYLVDKEDPESIRQYASYLKAGGKTIEGGKLEELVPDKEKLKRILNFEELK
ncbi:YkgJ family cysteine cluster protein [Candidatus Woesearchaeota archaeon]|nr:YkgJ family cysteine cluster protein [Candidatus Woesearchaeota archaeon]